MACWDVDVDVYMFVTGRFSPLQFALNQSISEQENSQSRGRCIKSCMFMMVSLTTNT
jgi:hypothetical protein